MLTDLPTEIIIHEIFSHLDECSKLVVRNVLWNTPIPDFLTNILQFQICQYSVNYLNFFQSKLDLRTIATHLASHSNLEGLKWARENGCRWGTGTCTAACVTACVTGQFEVLKWLRGNGCPWDKYSCVAIAYGGHLELLKWARENGCPWDKTTCHMAETRGHLELMKWARENGCPYT